MLFNNQIFISIVWLFQRKNSNVEFYSVANIRFSHHKFSARKTRIYTQMSYIYITQQKYNCYNLNTFILYFHTYISPIISRKYTHTNIDTHANIYILHYIYIVHTKIVNAIFYAQYKTLYWYVYIYHIHITDTIMHTKCTSDYMHAACRKIHSHYMYQVRKYPIKILTIIQQKYTYMYIYIFIEQEFQKYIYIRK